MIRVLREWLRRLRATLVRDRRDEDLEEELRLHLELVAAEARRRGHDPDEAVRIARLEAGGTAQAMEVLRDQRGLLWLEDLGRDVRYGLRVLRRSPAFAVVAILTLALGLGANAAIFHLIDALRLRSLPIANPDGLIEIRADGIDGLGIDAGPNGRVTYPLWEQIRTNQRAFSGVFAWANASGLVIGRGAATQQAEGLWVSGDFFRVLGLTPARGRLLASSDDSPACDASVAVVSHDFWQSSLGGSESVVGSTLTIVNNPFTVVGVAPAGFSGLEVGRTFDVALPLCVVVRASADVRRRDFWWLRVMGRPEPGTTVAAADAHLRALSPGILEATTLEGYTAELLKRYRSLLFTSVPAGRGVSRLRQTHSTSLSLLLGLTGLVLLITCGNLATLMLARAGAREREIAMRVAMGAPRRRLVSQMVVESLLIAVAGAAAAVPIAIVSASTLVTFLSTPDNPISLVIAPDWRLMAFVTAAAVVTTLLFGLVPALRVSLVDPVAATRQTSRGLTVDRHRARLRRGLVAGQIALSLVLVVSAALFVRSFFNLSVVDLGFDPDDLIVATFFDMGGFAPPEQRAAFREELTSTIRSTPGVVAVAASMHVPLGGDRTSHFFRLPDDAGAETRVARFAYVSPGYFETLRIPVLAGRGFDEHDHATSRRVLLVNDAFVRQHLRGANALGARLRTAAEGTYPETTYVIVGVVGNMKYDATLRDEDRIYGTGRDAMSPIAYVPIAQDPNPLPFVHMIVRATGSVPALAAEISRRFETIDPGVGVRVVEMAPRMGTLLATDRAMAWLAGAFGVLAIVLVVVGLYGVIAYLAVSRRTEIGIRLALGSTRAGIVRLVLRDSLGLLAAGALIGLPLAAVVLRGAETLLFDIAATDLPTLAGATVVLAAAGVVAGSLPAFRAALLPPMAAIRDEPESMWRTARAAVQRAVRDLTAGDDRAADTLTSEIAGAIHRAASFPEAVTAALGTLRDRINARPVLLLEKIADEYRGSECVIPAGGILINRLTHYRHPLPITPGDIQAWRKWATELRPQHLAEIDALDSAGVRIAVPLRTSHELAGVLLLGSPDSREAFTATETKLLSGAASVFALLIENARLSTRELEQQQLRRDLSLAAEVQKRLLPTELPSGEIAEFSAASMPARSIGGDYYDFLDFGGRRLGIALADVSGKGIAAALIMSAVQASLRIMAAERDISLPRLVANINEFLYRTTPGNKYATFFYAQLDGERRQLRYVNAGHNPPMLVRGGSTPDGGPEIHELTVGGSVVGMLPGLTYEEATVDLAAGDVLLAFTDGVSEAHDPQDAEFGEERLKDLLRQVAHLPAADIAARVSAALKDWIRDAEQFDDLTFIVMKVR